MVKEHYDHNAKKYIWAQTAVNNGPQYYLQESDLEIFLEKFLTNKEIINIPNTLKILEFYIRMALSIKKSSNKELLYSIVFYLFYQIDEGIARSFWGKIASTARGHFKDQEFQHDKNLNFFIQDASFIRYKLQNWANEQNKTISTTNPLTLRLTDLPSLEYNQQNVIEWPNVQKDIRDFFIHQLFETINSIFDYSQTKTYNLRILISKFEQIKPHLLKYLRKRYKYNKNYIFPYGEIWEKLNKMDK